MKIVDYNDVINRRNTNSLKWDVGETELPMWVGDMDFPTAPAVTKAIIKKAKSGVFGYQIVPDAWYDAIKRWWQVRHNFTIQKDWLCFCTGVVPAITSSIKRITNVGDNVVVMTPVYNVFFNSIENTGRHALESRLKYENGAYSIDWEDLEAKLSHPQSTMLLLCNPHNPVGKVWTKDELYHIGNLCVKHGVKVFSDEIHCDLVPLDVSYTPFASVSGVNMAISITAISASKAFNLAGLQAAAVFIENTVMRQAVVRGLNSDELAEPNAFAIEATIAAFSYESGIWLNGLRDHICGNKETATAYFEANLPEIKAISQDATYFMWLDCSAVTDDSKQLAEFIRSETGLLVSSGSIFRGNGNYFLRLNVACPEPTLLDGLNRLKQGIKLYKEKYPR